MLHFFHSLCVKSRNDESVEKLTENILEFFDMRPYDDGMISEEEFIYDSLNNKKLHQLLNNSLKTYGNFDDFEKYIDDTGAQETNPEVEPEEEEIPGDEIAE